VASVCRVLGAQRYDNNPVLADRWRMANVRFSVCKSPGRLHQHFFNSVHSSWNGYFLSPNETYFVVRSSAERVIGIIFCVNPGYCSVFELAGLVYIITRIIFHLILLIIINPLYIDRKWHFNVWM